MRSVRLEELEEKHIQGKETTPFLLIGPGITALVTIFPGISLALVK